MQSNCELPGRSLIFIFFSPLQWILSHCLLHMHVSMKVVIFEIVVHNFTRALERQNHVHYVIIDFWRSLMSKHDTCINLLLKCSTRLSSEVARSTTYRPSKLPMHNQLLSLQRPTHFNTVTHQYYFSSCREISWMKKFWEGRQCSQMAAAFRFWKPLTWHSLNIRDCALKEFVLY